VSPPSAGRGPVVVDTGVFAAELVRRGSPLAETYRPFLEGRPFIVSFVTVSEVRFGARLAGWGPTRLQRMELRLSTARVVWPGPQLVEVYADLRTTCVRAGHALGQKEHEADRWVAATALWLGIPLVAHDGAFKRLPGLELLTRLDNSDESSAQ
jgi:predicted nucleic acid-binding protein